MRKLEIGPGYNNRRMDGFETVDYQSRDNVDHVMDAFGKMDFEDDTFDHVYASHVLEHAYWQQVQDVLAEWYRIVKPGGKLEIWVPDALRAAKLWVAAEDGGERERKKLKQADKYVFKKWELGNNICWWANGKLNSFTGIQHPPFGDHKAFFSVSCLRMILTDAGFRKVEYLGNRQPLHYREKPRNFSIGVIAYK